MNFYSLPSDLSDGQMFRVSLEAKNPEIALRLDSPPDKSGSE